MDLTDIAGLNVYSVSARKDFLPLYYSPKFEGEAHCILYFIEKGEVQLEFDKGAVRAGPGHLVCYESSRLQRVRAVPGSPPSFLAVTFDLLSRLGGLLRPAEIGIPLLFKPGKPRPVARALRQLHAAWIGRKRHYQVECAMLGLGLLRILADSTLSVVASVRRRGIVREDSGIGQSLEHIRFHYKEDLRIETLAKKAGLRPRTFVRRFKQATGLSPRRYILIRKIEQAKDHLLQDNLPFYQTAEELGFADYSNFFKAFRKITGTTPLNFYRARRPISN